MCQQSVIYLKRALTTLMKQLNQSTSWWSREWQISTSNRRSEANWPNKNWTRKSNKKQSSREGKRMISWLSKSKNYKINWKFRSLANAKIVRNCSMRKMIWIGNSRGLWARRPSISTKCEIKIFRLPNLLSRSNKKFLKNPSKIVSFLRLYNRISSLNSVKFQGNLIST